MVERKHRRPFTIEGATLMFKNFSGRPNTLHPNGGYRDFSVQLDEELASILSEDGWNVKSWKPKNSDPEDDPILYLPVAVSYKYKVPKIWIVNSKGKVFITEDTVGDIDFYEIVNADVVIDASFWEMGGKTGIKAYLNELYLKIEENDLQKKYADVPELRSKKFSPPTGDEVLDDIPFK